MLFIPSRNYNDICEPLHSPVILHAEAFAPNERLVQGHRSYKDELQSSESNKPRNYIHLYQITLEVKPSQARFEALVQYNNVSTYYDLVGEDISRINQYGDQSICITEKILRKYCYCKVK